MAVIVDPEFSAPPAPLADLFAAVTPGSFFDQALWYDIFARHATDPGTVCRAYVGDGVGLLLQQEAGARRLRSLANYYSCEYAALRVGNHDAGAALCDLVGEIVAERPRWEVVGFTALDPADPLFATLAKALRAAGLMVEAWAEFGTWYESTAGLDFAAYLAQRPGTLANTWRRKRAKATKMHRLGFDIFGAGDDADRAVADYEAVYRASWKGAEPYAMFMPALIRRTLPLGLARVGVLRLDGVPAAAQVWILWRGRATIYKLAHDSRFDALSPGTLLTMHMMEHVLEAEQPVEIDFGRGDDSYKKLWLPRRRERWAIRAADPRTPRGLALAARWAAGRLRAHWRRPAQAG